jgi:RimJ/RimL family protein N-acetyltransferase
MVPVIETERLRLRGHEAGDFEVCLGLWRDPVVTRYIGGKPYTREEVWARMLRYAGLWPMLGFGYWLVEEKATGAFVGELGFASFRRDMEPGFEDALEAGWILSPAAHGKGYATEAMAAVHVWGAERFPGKAMVCIVHEENAASLRMAARCCYREEARSLYRGVKMVVMRRVK